jgi:hypothetical protein
MLVLRNVLKRAAITVMELVTVCVAIHVVEVVRLHVKIQIGNNNIISKLYDKETCGASDTRGEE